MMRFLKYAVLALALVSGAAQAAPIKWTVQLSFGLDGDVEGMFIYDPATLTFSDIELVSSGSGAGFPNFAFTVEGNGSNEGQLLALADGTDPNNAAGATGILLVPTLELAIPTGFGDPTSGLDLATILTCDLADCSIVAPSAFTLTFASLTAGPVPLPAPVALLGAGLAGLVLVRRRRKRAAVAA